MKRVTAIVGLAVLITAVAGCGSASNRAGSVGRRAPTHLTVVADGPSPARRAWHLSCNPPSGTVPRPTQACAAIAAEPTLITKPRGEIGCLGGVNLSIVGRLNGKPVHTFVGTCLTRDVPLVNKLGLLGP